jgi:protein-tyrosine-phosphatase
MKTKILFVCHGNICRSAIAEYLFKDMLRKSGQGDAFDLLIAMDGLKGLLKMKEERK